MDERKGETSKPDPQPENDNRLPLSPSISAYLLLLLSCLFLLPVQLALRLH